MLKRIHIFGASGSGTTTLGRELAKKLNIPHFDTDNYFWIKTVPPFQQKRSIEERIELLNIGFDDNEGWISSGSLCGWGDIFIPQFDLAVYLYIPKEIRMQRLKDRERERYGSEIDKDGNMYKNYTEFVDWAASYDEGDVSHRSKALHEEWMKKLSCKVLRLEGDMTVEERVNAVLEIMNNY